MVTVEPSGMVRFEIYLPQASRIEIRGDFTFWHAAPIVMDRQPDGRWTALAPIGPGDHEFRYFVDGWRWITDFAAHGVRRNEFGSWNSGLNVPFSGRDFRRAA